MRKVLVAASVVLATLSACEVDTGSGTGSSGNNPDYTTAQQNAIESAQSYVDMSGFSRDGLIQQLTSKAGEGFKKPDAVFAVNHIKVDWNKEAVEAAEAYLASSSFSRAGLIQQLSSKAGEQFTHAQAVYAANKVGL